MERRSVAQVVTYAQGWNDPRYLGAIGHVAGLKYSYAWPGGCDQLSCLLQVPPKERVTAMNPGRLVKAFKGASCIWQGQLDEPTPDVTGWTISAHGNGTFGTQFLDIWDTWADADDHINNAISRGLLWRNHGIDGTSGLWYGDETDAGSQTITDFLNSITVQGGLGWNIDRRDGTLTVIPLPTAVDRILVSNTPVARTVAQDVNSLWIRYESAADNTATATSAAIGLVNETNAADIALHGTTESYYDITGNGPTSAGSAQQNAKNALSRFNRANFAGPFAVGPGQLLNAGGFPVDLSVERAGRVCRLVMTDFGYGGEVLPDPVTFIVGGYEYDDTTQSATVTPFQNAFDDFQSLLAAIFPIVTTAA